MVLRRIIMGALVFLVLTGLIVGIFVCIQVENLKPVYKGTLSVEGLENSVYIRRDTEGVIHVQGHAIGDVIFASGFVTARERLWQMELMRRVATGRLSEIFGEKTVGIDRLFLTLGLDSLTHLLLQSISPESRTWLEQYSKGINACLQEMGDDVPVEFLLMKMKPQEWTPQDCLLQTRLMAWFLNFNWKADFLYWELSKSLPQDKFREIWPRWRKYPDIIAGGVEGRTNYQIFGLLRQLYATIGVGGTSAGSNSWVVSPARSGNSAAMLANDPHLQIQFPSIWIELHLTADNFNVAGFALPGTPGIIIGRNDEIAWGLTNGMIDDSDYFIEKIDTTEGIYWLNEKKIPLNIRQRIIHVKDKPDVVFNVYSTVNGPVLNSLFNGFGSFEPLSFKWTGWEKSDELQSIIELARSRNWSDFKDALRSYGVPAQNFVFAARTGEIGYRLGGLVPLRNYDNGLLPVDGFSGKSRWQGFIPVNKMPSSLNPKQGFIVTANNQISSDYPYYLSDLWEPPYRAMRIEELIRDKDKLSEADLQRIQFDYKDLMAQDIMPIILPDLHRLPNMTDREEKTLILLKNWTFVMDTESIAAAVYEELKYTMIRNIFADEMGEDLFNIFTDLPNFYLRIFVGVFFNEESPWFDNINTGEIETRTSIIQKSFREALNRLVDSQGEEMQTWRWGMVHQIILKHSLGRVPLTEILFNRGPFSVGGNGCTVNVGTYSYKDPFIMIAGASMRMVVNWRQPDQYLSIIPGGESGNFLSEYYDNQMERWLSGGLKIVSMRKPETGKKVIILNPKSGNKN